MRCCNTVIFAYRQTASGKTPYRAQRKNRGLMKDVLKVVKSEEGKGREYLLRCSYLEIPNETIFVLLEGWNQVGFE
jgi:hypothetical protein